jgi:two-component system phosphate regulon sensor histidine kinase PhoR
LLRRSIRLPLALGIALVALALTLAVAWNVIVVSDLGPVAERLSGLHWALLVAGWLFFALLIAGLLLLCAWLVREMRQSQRQQAFLDAVTHEMKTPLASLRLYLDTLALRDPGPEQRLEFLARMRQDVERLERTVVQVLAAARAAAWTRKPHREPVPLAGILDRCVRELRERYRLPPEAVRLEVEGAPTALGQPDELELVFLNLIDNAVKYSGPEVDVRVRARADGEGGVRVEIDDRGVGIPRAELRRIFQPFYRFGLDVQRRVAGLGLGLFIVRWLVQRQGGRVEARSEGPGRGSRFAVALRAAAPSHTVPLALEPHAQNPGR